MHDEGDRYALGFCHREDLEWIWARRDQAFALNGHPLIRVGSAVRLDPLHLFGSIAAGHRSCRSFALQAIRKTQDLLLLRRREAADFIQ